MSFDNEFSDFGAANLPPIPVGWLDESWHNDICPRFIAYKSPDGARLSVWIDFVDAAQREFPDAKRFRMDWEDAEGSPDSTLIETDDWAVVLATVETEIQKLLTAQLGRG